MPLTWDGSANLRLLLDKVLEVGKVTITCEDRRRAMRVRQQLHEARSLDRENSTEMYEPTDDRYGKSPYDAITTSIETDPRTKQAILTVYVTKEAGLVGVLSIQGPDGEDVKL